MRSVKSADSFHWRFVLAARNFSTSRGFGHLLAIITIIIWGTTYISTKVLLTGFEPTEILIIRFIMGFLILFFLHPHILKPQGWKREIPFALAGLCGITLYYLLENIALVYTQASNVGVIICVAPFFTAFIARAVWGKAAPLRLFFFLGFVLAMIGISLISFTGTSVTFSLKGDLLALLAAIVWSFYSVITKILSDADYPVIQITRRYFFYAIILMIPALIFLPFSPDFTLLKEPRYLLNILFLGIVASAICFITWNSSVKIIGAVTSSIYIYLTPVVTVITAMIVLHEHLAPSEWIGVVITMIGLLLSEYRPKKHTPRLPE